MKKPLKPHWQKSITDRLHFKQTHSPLGHSAPSFLLHWLTEVYLTKEWWKKLLILWHKWETLFTCPYTFKFWTHPLTGTASGMASDSLRSRFMTHSTHSYLWIYGVGHIVKDHADSERLAVRDLLYALSLRQDSTYHNYCYTSCGVMAGIRNILMSPPWRIDPMTHCTMSGCSVLEIHLTLEVCLMELELGFNVHIQSKLL